MGTLEKPEKVKKAQLAGDHEALSRMGRKGREHGTILQILHKEDRQGVAEEIVREQAKLYTISPEGDVLPPTDMGVPFKKKRG